MKYIFKKNIYTWLAAVFDAVGYLFFLFARKRHQPSPSNPRSILIVRLDHIGDCLTATAIPKILKENIPGVKVVFLTPSSGKILLANNPFVDEVIGYDAPWFASPGFGGSCRSVSPQMRSSGFVFAGDSPPRVTRQNRQDPPKLHYALQQRAGFLAVARLLRGIKIDMAIGLRGDVRENILMWLARIPERIGYGITGGGFLLTKEACYRKGVHESEHAMDLLKVLGIQVRSLKPQLYFSPEDERNLESKCAEWGLDKAEKIIGLQVGAGSSSKEWPAEHVQTFLKIFSSKFPNYKVVLLGNRSVDLSQRVTAGGAPHSSAVCGMTDEDEWGCPPAGPADRDQYIDLIGRTSLRELCVLMKRLTCFIGPDSGPTHIAASLGIPTIFLYSGTNIFEQWKPLFENARVLRHEVSCSPCGLRRCSVPGHPCMSGITPDQVIEILRDKIT